MVVFVGEKRIFLQVHGFVLNNCCSWPLFCGNLLLIVLRLCIFLSFFLHKERVERKVCVEGGIMMERGHKKKLSSFSINMSFVIVVQLAVRLITSTPISLKFLFLLSFFYVLLCVAFWLLFILQICLNFASFLLEQNRK